MSARSERLLPLKNKDFRLFLSTRVCLTIALQIQAVIAGWHIYKLTEDPLSLGLIGLAEAIPALSIALYAGHLADISSKRKILLNSILMMLFCSTGLTIAGSDYFVLGFSTAWSVNAMYVFIFLSGFARGFYAPAGFSFIAQLVDKTQLVTASTLNSSSWQIAAIFGPALGGLLYAWIGITYTFFVVLFFIAVATVCMSLIKPRPISSMMGSEGIGHRLKVGLKYVFANKVVLSAISLDLFAVLFGGAVALLPVFSNEILHAGPQGLGMLRAAPSLGASITMIWLSLKAPFKKPGVVLLVCVALFGFSMIGFALSTSLYLSLFMLFLGGAFDSVSVVIRGNILQLQTPDEMRGRVSAVNTMFIGSSNEIGAFESGVAAKLMGTVPSVVFGGCMTLLVVAFTSIKSPTLKKYNYEPVDQA
jgi:MFS family permease